MKFPLTWVLFLIVITRALTDDKDEETEEKEKEIDITDLMDLYKINWSYLTSLPDDPDEILYKTYAFSEEEPWSGVVCPGGTYISKLSYNFVSSITSFLEIDDNRLSPYQMKHKEEIKSIMEIRDQMKGAVDKEILREKDVKYESEMEKWFELRKKIDKNPGPNNMMTLWPLIQLMEENVSILKIRKQLIDIEEHFNDEDLFVPIYEQDALLTLREKLYLKHCMDEDFETNVRNTPLCTHEDFKHHREKYLKYKNEETDHSEESETDKSHVYPSDFGSCGSLAHCVGHQACIFRFSNDFCKNDPFPGQRKKLNITIACQRDEKITEFIDDTEFLDLEEVTEEAKTWPSYVVFPKYKPVTEYGSQDYHTVEIVPNLTHEKEVFEKSCPSPEDAVTTYGFRGNCTKTPDPNGVPHFLWTSLGRAPEQACREEIWRAFCAFAYDPTGHCVPPGITEETDSNEPQYSFKSIPTPGQRFDLSAYNKVYDHPHQNLIPARLGFGLTAHQHPEYLVELLKLIYAPEHYYAIHVDYRKEKMRNDLVKMIKLAFKSPPNIRVLPKERSFVASWGSYQIIRAELEVYEELLRMGVWDFGILMSGSDLPLRNIKDLTAALAPHRGHMFLRINGGNPVAMQHNGYLWYSCGGHTYCVGGRHHEKERWVYGHSAWAVLSREFLEEILGKDRHPEMSRIQFYQQTAVIPDENYFGALIPYSKYKDKLADTGFHFLKHFDNRNVNSLCKHSDDTDGCGQGPGIFDEEDVENLKLFTNHFFFARKFAMDSEDLTRQFMINVLKENSYHKAMTKYYPPSVINQLALKAVKKYMPQLSTDDYKVADVTNFMILPTLIHPNPCCSSKRVFGHEQFRIWIDYVLANDKGEHHTIRASILPNLPYTCLPEGHISSFHMTTRNEKTNEDEEGKRRTSTLREGLPIPTAPAGGDIMWVNFWIHEQNTSKECQEYAASHTYPKVSLEKEGDSLFAAVLKDSEGEVYGDAIVNLHIAYDHFEPERPFNRETSMLKTRHRLTAGKWHLTLTQLGVKNPIVYEQSAWLANEDDPESYEQMLLDHLDEMFDVEDAIILDEDFGVFYKNTEV